MQLHDFIHLTIHVFHVNLVEERGQLVQLKLVMSNVGITALPRHFIQQCTFYCVGVALQILKRVQ